MPKDKPVQYIPLFSSTVFEEAIGYVKWWYTEIPFWILRLFKRVTVICDDTFSISILLKTFFIPWHRDYSVTGRVFGILTRLIYLPIVISITIVILVLIILFLIIWLTLPGIFIFNITNSFPS